MALAGLLRGMIRLSAVPSPFWPGLGVRRYAKKPAAKAKGKVVSKEDLKGPEICKDPLLLTTHSMGTNIYKEGSEVSLKPDSEYPEWLFQMYLGPPKKLEDLDPETMEYWRLLRKLNIKQRNKLGKQCPY